MTANQLQYWANQEQIRHNKQMEDNDWMKAEAAQNQAEAAIDKNVETQRHNWEMENIAMKEAEIKAADVATKSANVWTKLLDYLT